jgi:hypothetical protein
VASKKYWYKVYQPIKVMINDFTRKSEGLINRDIIGGTDFEKKRSL